VNTAAQIQRFVAELVDEPARSRDPLADGLIDSLAIEQLIHYLEISFNVEFEDHELVPENFASIEVLASFVDAKRRGTT